MEESYLLHKKHSATTQDFHFEVCGDQLEEILRACINGATRIELCGDLSVGGVTPSEELFRSLREGLLQIGLAQIPIFVMIRPRSGNFVFDKEEFETAVSQTRKFVQLGADGIVFGSLDAEGNINIDQLEMLLNIIPKHIPVTFHRAIDEAKDCETALETLLNFIKSRANEGGNTSSTLHRVLSSGGMPSALEGVEVLARMVQKAKTHLIVIPGCGINVENITHILNTTGAKEVHGSFKGCVKECLEQAYSVWQKQ